MDWLRRPGLAVWSTTTLIVTVVLGITLVGPPSGVIWTSPITLFVTITIAASLCVIADLAVIATAHRRDLAEVGFLRLYGVGGHRAHLFAALGFTLIGLTSLVWVGEHAFSVGWWFVHALDVAGVFTAAFALLAQRVRRTVLDVLQPILSNDPLVAFELGLEPVVHEFVARLDRKDAITRDHVVAPRNGRWRSAQRSVSALGACGSSAWQPRWSARR